MNKIELREYQEEIIRILMPKLSPDVDPDRYLIQLPTGMGKTVIFAHLLWKLGRRAIVLAHRRELLFQAKKKLIECSGGEIKEEDVDIVLQSRPNSDSQIWVASVQTLCRGDRVDDLRGKVNIIIIDEAHHAIADSYQDIMKAFPDAPGVGFTATVRRSSKKENKALADFFSGGLLYKKSLKAAIVEGWLAFILYYTVKTDASLDDVSTRGGDFASGELSRKVNYKARNLAAVQKYIEVGGGKAVFFCVDISHVKAMWSHLYDTGIKTEMITGSTPDDERERILEEFDKADPRENFALVNCMVCAEGWDCPSVRVIVLARPTKSEIVYLQCLGRGTRKDPTTDKEEVIIIDMVDNCKSKKLCRCLTTVFGLDPNIEIEGNVIREMSNRLEQAKEKENELGNEQEQLSIELSKILFSMPMEIEKSRMAWFSPEDCRYFCQLSKDETFEIRENTLGFELFKNGHEVMKSIDVEEVLSYAFCKARSYEETEFMWSKAERQFLSGKKPSEKQIKILKKYHPEINPDLISMETASNIIGASIAKNDGEKASKGQIWKLKSLGWDGDFSTLSKRKAGSLIGKLKGGKS